MASTEGASMARRARSGLLAVPLAVALAWASMTPVGASPGDLDRTFRHDGTAITNLTPWNENVGDVAIQDDGKIVVVGRASSRGGYGGFAIVRYRADGRLDPGFGDDGVVITNVAKREDAASAVAIQRNGRIVVVGTATVEGLDAVAIVRYRPNGALDRTFGARGIALLDLSAGAGHETASDVAMQPDRRIVVAATVSGSGSFALARLDPSGALDETFHGDGTATADIGAEIALTSGVAIQADGSIVVAGSSWTEAAFDGIAVVRFTPGGQVDGSFGDGGVATVEFTAGTDGGGDGVGGVAIQRNGRIVVAGDAGGAGEYTSRFGVARFLDDGSLDRSFGGDGTVRTNFTRWDDSASDLAVQANGKIVVVGVAGFMWGSLPTFALARYRIDGTLDPAFGDGGRVRTIAGGVPPPQQTDIMGSWATAVALQADGRIVVAGDADRMNGDRIDGRFAVARYRAA
jgi:uncharacterized delta-60 repeat protein